MSLQQIVAEFRAALAAEDWTRADALLADYDAGVRAAADAGLSHAAWIHLRTEHAALLEEVVAMRDAAARALARHARARDGTRAYQAQRP